MRIHEVVTLKERYGNITLEELIVWLMGNNKFKCPSCDGRGGLMKASYSRDWKSGEEYQDGIYEAKCEQCNGIGYTATELKPKMVQMGWQ